MPTELMVKILKIVSHPLPKILRNAATPKKVTFLNFC